MAKSICPRCHYYRKPDKIELFDREDLMNPEVQKVQHELSEWHRQRTFDEEQRVANRYLFEAPPLTYAWCDGFSRQIDKFYTRNDARAFREELLRGGSAAAREHFHGVVAPAQDLVRASAAGDREAAARLEAIRDDRIDGISGEFIPYFVLVMYVNQDEQCDLWKARTE
jgi:hypothetical protein